MGPKMLTEHAQMHAGKCERCSKSENPKGEGKLGNEIGGVIKNIFKEMK